MPTNSKNIQRRSLQSVEDETWWKNPKVGVQLVMVLILAPLTPMMIPWRWDWWEAWVYAIFSDICFIASRMLISTDLLKERSKAFEHDNVEPFDLYIVKLIALGLLAVPITAGLEAKSGALVTFGVTAKSLALIMIVSGYVFGTWALVENEYFSGVVRIQKDRGHLVVDSGPYRVVRHPGYLGSIITYVATPVWLDSVWAYLPVLLLVGIFCVRTALEDETLQNKLPRYKEYSRRTRYKLFPGIW